MCAFLARSHASAGWAKAAHRKGVSKGCIERAGDGALVLPLQDGAALQQREQQAALAAGQEEQPHAWRGGCSTARPGAAWGVQRSERKLSHGASSV